VATEFSIDVNRKAKHKY